MAVSAAEARFLDSISLDAPWSLVEAFATMPRWRPEDVNAGADHIASVLERLGVPVTVHEPEIYLSIPLRAEVRVGGETYRAKPPSMSISAPAGVEAGLVHLETDPNTYRSYTRDPSEIFTGEGGEVRKRVAGKVVVMAGFANPRSCSLLEEWGARPVIAVNPGVDIHWGTCTTIWGSPDLDDLPRKPSIAVVAVNNPDGQKIIAAARAGESATVVTEMMEGWYRQKIPVVDIPGTVEPQRFVLLHGHYDSWDVGVGDNATGDATMLELARVLWDRRGELRRSVRIAWWPGHSTGRYAGSTWYADAFAVDLDENCVAQIDCDSPGCRWATSYHQTTCMTEARPHVARAIEDVTGQKPKFKRPNQAGDYSFNNIGLSSYYMLSSTMPDALRDEKGYYAVGGCGGNIAWHTDNDTLEIADRGIMLRDIKVYLEIAGGIADAEILPFEWRAQLDEFVATVDAYQHAAGAGFDLGPAKVACLSLRRALAGF